MMLTPARFAVVERFMEQLDDAVSYAVRRHNELLKGGLPVAMISKVPYDLYQKALWHGGTVVGVRSTAAEIKWDEYARSCHVDGGTFDIPVAALCPATRDATIKKIVEDKLEHILTKLDEKAKGDRAYKVAQLNKLKQELGEE